MSSSSPEAAAVRVSLVYRGTTLDRSEAGASALRQGADGFARAFAEAARVIYGSTVHTQIQVKADGDLSSFDVTLVGRSMGAPAHHPSEIAGRMERVLSVLVGPRELGDSTAGLSPEASPVASPGGVFGLLVSHPGLAILDANRAGDRVMVVFEGGVVEWVPADEHDVATDHVVRAAISDLLSPLGVRGAETLTIQVGGRKATTLRRGDIH